MSTTMSTTSSCESELMRASWCSNGIRGSLRVFVERSEHGKHVASVETHARRWEWGVVGVWIPCLSAGVCGRATAKYERRHPLFFKVGCYTCSCPPIRP